MFNTSINKAFINNDLLVVDSTRYYKITLIS